MFGDEMSGARMETASEERADEEVEERIAAEKPIDGVAERELDGEVGSDPAAELLRPYEPRSEGVKEYLEGAEERLAEDVLQTEHLETSRQVGVDAVLAEVLVVLRA